MNRDDRTQVRRRPRRGAVLFAALACLLIVVSLLGAMLQGTLAQRRQMRTLHQLRQTEQLLAAGVARAQAQLARDADYSGETWSLESDEIVGRGAGQIVIEVGPSDEAAGSRVHVVAEYPLGGERSIRRSRTLVVTNPQPLPEEE
ncbi:MAG TPA: hypothetical protein PKC18_16815 [Lacipirellulaceae bacterium]|nr:hypothetical protein [Lacipirellulaceae bacterium]